MKKNIMALGGTLCTMLLTAFLGGCVSNNLNLLEYSPVAIASVYSEDQIPWYSEDGEKGSGVLNSLVTKSMDSSNPEYVTVQSRIDDAALCIERSLEAAGIEVLPSSIVTSAPIYEATSKAFFVVADTKVPADGMKSISYSSSKRNRQLCKETGASSVLFAEFQFYKLKVNTTFGSYGVKAMVQMKIYVADASGSLKVRRTYEAVSDQTIEYKNGSWDKQAVCELFPSTIKKTVDAFVADYIQAPEVEVLEMPEGELPFDESTEIQEEEYVYEGEATVITLPLNFTTPSQD